MNKKIVFLLILLLALPVFAETSDSIRGLKEKTREKKEDFRSFKEEKKDEFKTFKEKTKTELKEFKKEHKNKIDELKEKQTEFKEKIKTKREDLKTAIKNKKENLKEEILKIKDEKKQKLIERLDERFDNINEKTTDNLLNRTHKLERILKKVIIKTDKAEKNGLNVSDVKTAVIDAENSLKIAITAITEQSGKIYEIKIEGEETLRKDMISVRKTVHDDLTKVRQTVKDAQQAIRNAIIALSKIPRIDDLQINDDDLTATSTNTTTIQDSTQ